MFLTNRELGISQFLKALNFIPPQGKTVAYFISPGKIELPDNSGYSEIELPEDESITYIKDKPILKIDQAQSPDEYSHWEPDKLGRRIPTPNILPEFTDTSELKSPFMKVINESIDGTCDLRLMENYGPFLKNTIFHCKKLKEEAK